MPPRDPLGPLMNLNVGHVPLVALQRLANRMRAAKIPVTAPSAPRIGW